MSTKSYYTHSHTNARVYILVYIYKGVFCTSNPTLCAGPFRYFQKDSVARTRGYTRRTQSCIPSIIFIYIYIPSRCPSTSIFTVKGSCGNCTTEGASLYPNNAGESVFIGAKKLLFPSSASSSSSSLCRYIYIYIIYTPRYTAGMNKVPGLGYAYICIVTHNCTYKQNQLVARVPNR